METYTLIEDDDNDRLFECLSRLKTTKLENYNILIEKKLLKIPILDKLNIPEQQKVFIELDMIISE